MFDQAALEMVCADQAFSGVVTAESGGVAVAVAVGSADRANGRPNRLDTRFATASMTKGFTAVAIVSLVESGDLTLGTRLRDLVGEDLPNVDPRVTIEALLGHRSGVGDYLDEELLDDIDEHVPGIPSAHSFETPDDYLPLVAAAPQVNPPGERFAYNNGGFIMLSVAIERASGRGFHDIVRDRVFSPAGMTTAGFFRADDLPANTAIGYLRSGRSNVFHLPVVGGGDGGAYVTAADMTAFWEALFAGRLLSSDNVQMVTAHRSETNEEGHDYGLGFWLTTGGTAVVLEGMDAGVSCRSSYDPATGATYTVLANDSSCAWPIARHLETVIGAT